MSSLIQIEQSPLLYSKNPTNIDEQINKMVRKIKNQHQILGDFVKASSSQERVVLSQHYEDIHCFSVYHQLILIKNKQTIRSRTIICKNNQPLFLGSQQQKRMVMNWLFCRLAKTSNNFQQKMSINLHNGIIGLHGSQFHIKNMYEISNKLFPLIKIIYFIHRRFILQQLPKMLYIASLLPEDYEKIYSSFQVYKEYQISHKFKTDKKIDQLKKIYTILHKNQSQLLQMIQNRQPMIQGSYHAPIHHFQKVSHIYGLTMITQQQLTQLPFKQLKNCLHIPVPKQAKIAGENKYIFNYIKILEENKFQPILVKRGGFSNILFVQSKFQYQENITTLRQEKKTSTKLKRSQPSFDRPILCKVFCLKIAKSPQYNYTVQHQKKVLSNFHEISSPYLLKYYVCTLPNFAYKHQLMMDAVNTPNFSQFLDILSTTTSLMTKLFYLTQISNSICFFKEYHMVHLDLKLNNVLILFREYLIKVIDFGQTFHENSISKNYKPGHTMPYAPPQLLQRQKSSFTYKSDIFSFAVMLFEALFNKYPFYDIANLKESFRKKNYMKKVIIIPEAFENYCSPKIMRMILGLILRSLSPDRASRPQPQSITIILKYCLNIFAQFI